MTIWVDEPLMAHFDEEKIKLVLLNYLDNAVEYTLAGSIRVKVGVEDGVVSGKDVSHPSPQRRGQGEVSGIAIRVIDMGIGFNEEDRLRLFQKFQRGANASGTNVHNSAGLGLYLVRKFIEGHGGYVWAESEGEGKGSEFGIWIPINRRD